MPWAFLISKQVLQNVTMLVYSNPSAPTSFVDAPNISVWAVLEQHLNGQWYSVAFFSRKLCDPETRYSTFDRELLAIYFSIHHFHHFVEGREFCVYTDHKPLTFGLSSVSDKWTPGQTSHLLFIAEFTSDIHQIQGKNNPVADGLPWIQGVETTYIST